MSEESVVARSGDRTPGTISRHLLADAASLPGRRVAFVDRCGGCGHAVDEKAFALRCRSCGASLVQDSDLTERAKPDGLLPFTVDEDTARAAFTTWVATRRFAPETLKGTRRPRSIDGVFLPFWAFSADTVTDYAGERGENRHRQVMRTRTGANGQSETHWETESYTDWHRTSGQVWRSFSDLMLPACSPLAAKIPPWDLEGMTPYARGSSSGRRVIAYDVEPEHGFDRATARMRDQIEHDIRADIGGDHQRVGDTTTTYRDPAYTLLLLPAWLVSYVHGGKTWSVLVNGTSGEVAGERPYSAAKISVLIGALVLAVAAVSVVVAMRH